MAEEGALTAKNANVHLGNCSGFRSVMRTSRKGNVLPLGVFDNFGSVLVGHKIYVFGGHLGRSNSSASLFVGDSNTYEWSTVRLHNNGISPRKTHMAGYFVHADALFVAVRCSSVTVRIDVLKLDLVIPTSWQKLMTLNLDTFRFFPCAAYHEANEEMVLCNGEQLCIFRADDLYVRFQETKGEKPKRRHGYKCCLSPSTFFMFGDSNLRDSDLYALTLRTMSWAAVKLKSEYTPKIRHNASMSYTNGRIFIMGGYPAETMMKEFEVFEVSNQTWKCIHSRSLVATDDKPELEGGVYGGTRAHGAIITRDKLMIIAGLGLKFTDLNVMEVSPLIN